MQLDEWLADRLEDPAFRAEYEAQAPRFERAQAFIAARAAAGLTQAELADRLGVSQPVVARLESGNQPPKLDTLQALARATGVGFAISPDGAFTCVPIQAE